MKGEKGPAWRLQVGEQGVVPLGAGTRLHYPAGLEVLPLVFAPKEHSHHKLLQRPWLHFVVASGESKFHLANLFNVRFQFRLITQHNQFIHSE